VIVATDQGCKYPEQRLEGLRQGLRETGGKLQVAAPAATLYKYPRRLDLPGKPGRVIWLKGDENMLAAECAWAILRAEHTRIRELLALVDGRLKTGDWTRPRSQAASLVELIERLQAFDETMHRPKGVVLLEILRGRSAEVDKLLNQLELEREHCDSLLSQSKTMLKAAESGDMGAAEAVEALLQEHRQSMHAQLDREDTLLHSQTGLLLTGEEWAAVVSSMSEAMEAAKERDRGRPFP
jgi:hemerythrin-like domain-containing protein